MRATPTFSTLWPVVLCPYFRSFDEGSELQGCGPAFPDCVRLAPGGGSASGGGLCRSPAQPHLASGRKATCRPGPGPGAGPAFCDSVGGPEVSVDAWRLESSRTRPLRHLEPPASIPRHSGSPHVAPRRRSGSTANSRPRREEGTRESCAQQAAADTRRTLDNVLSLRLLDTYTNNTHNNILLLLLLLLVVVVVLLLIFIIISLLV